MINRVAGTPKDVGNHEKLPILSEPYGITGMRGSLADLDQHIDINGYIFGKDWVAALGWGGSIAGRYPGNDDKETGVPRPVGVRRVGTLGIKTPGSADVLVGKGTNPNGKRSSQAEWEAMPTRRSAFPGRKKIRQGNWGPKARRR